LRLEVLMRFVTKGILSLALLGLGCNLLSEDDGGGAGEYPPPVYKPGTGGGASGGAAGTAGLDAGMGGAAGTAGGAGGPGKTDAGPADRASVPPGPDAATATRWVEFGRSFTQCSWFNAQTALCTTKPALPASGTTLAVELHKTVDGGKTWQMVSSVDTGNSSVGASVRFFMPNATGLWYVTGFSGFGQSGSIGSSSNGGQRWFSVADKVFAALDADPKDGIVPQVPLWDIVSAAGKIWVLAQGESLVVSTDGGFAWEKLACPPDFAKASVRGLVATSDTLLLRFLKPDQTLGLYRWSGLSFAAVEASVPVGSPGNHAGTWLRSSLNVAGTLMVDRGPLPDWGFPFSVHAIRNGGRSFEKLLAAASAADTDVVGLRDGLVIEHPTSLKVYLSGVFTDAQKKQWLQIRKSTDRGATWSALHSEPYDGTLKYISVSVDQLGNLHAMRHGTDTSGKPSNYDAHYLVE
jgi:hypothetical protein